jgi:hypothetical protein
LGFGYVKAGSAPGGQPGRLDIAEFPGRQDADEQQHGEPDPEARARAMRLVLALPLVPSFIMKYRAAARLPRMAMKANAIRYDMNEIIRP